MFDFMIIKTGDLTQEQKKQLSALAALCRKIDGASISYPMQEEDEAFHYLMVHKEEPNRICSALAIIPIDEVTAECTALTAPAFRRLGCFSELLELASSDFEDCDILFAIPENLPIACAVLDAIGAEFDHCEHAMEFQISPCTGTEDLYEKLQNDSEFSCIQEEPSTLVCSYRPADSRKASASGSFCLTVVSDGCLCLHQVEISKKLRGKGLGTRMIRRLLELLSGSGIRKVILQVSGINKAALAVYKKTGFQITETLSFYLY